MSTKSPRYGTIDREFGLRLATTPHDDDGPILMVNLMKYHDRAEYADGDDRGISGREADDRYAPVEVLQDIGAQVVLFGDVETQLLGQPAWDRVGCVEYPTRRSFIEMQSRRDFQDKHEHKAAGMAETIVMGCVPISPPALANEFTEVAWADVEHPSTTEDGPIVVVHALRFAEDVGEAAMDGYHDAAFRVAARHGARIGGWYGVEGTIVGDGRRWDQVRFNLFPSNAAFLAVVADPERQAAQKEHRERAIADTYTMIVRASVNRLPGAR
jgi:hypothetical protein